MSIEYLSDVETFDGELGVSIQPLSRKGYGGPLDVTPKASDDILLPTKGKVVPEDIRVRKVPFYSTDNASGGKTVYIAREE